MLIDQRRQRDRQRRLPDASFAGSGDDDVHVATSDKTVQELREELRIPELRLLRPGTDWSQIKITVSARFQLV
jgi:hypothetical protein